MAIKKTIRIKHHKDKVMKKMGLTVREHGKAIKFYKKFYEKGVTVKNALALSLGIDFAKMKEEIKLAGLTANRNGQLIFTVQASNKHLNNKYGHTKSNIAKKHYVHIEFDKEQLSKFIKEEKSTNDILLNTHFKYQCSCGRHSYWFRYLWTVINSSIGLQENRFPRIRNRELQGMLCKHGIRTMLFMQTPRFLGEFERYLVALKEGKGFRTKNPFLLE